MVNWNTSLFYVRVCLPAPLERPMFAQWTRKYAKTMRNPRRSGSSWLSSQCVMLCFSWNVQFEALQLGWMNFQSSGHARKFYKCINFVYFKANTQVVKFNASLSRYCVYSSRGSWATSMIYNRNSFSFLLEAIKSSFIYLRFLIARAKKHFHVASGLCQISNFKTATPSSSSSDKSGCEKCAKHRDWCFLIAFMASIG